MNKRRLVLGTHLVVGLGLVGLGAFLYIGSGELLPSAFNAALGLVVIAVGRSVADNL